MFGSHSLKTLFAKTAATLTLAGAGFGLAACSQDYNATYAGYEITSESSAITTSVPSLLVSTYSKVSKNGKLSMENAFGKQCANSLNYAGTNIVDENPSSNDRLGVIFADQSETQQIVNYAKSNLEDTGPKMTAIREAVVKGCGIALRYAAKVKAQGQTITVVMPVPTP